MPLLPEFGIHNMGPIYPVVHQPNARTGFEEYDEGRRFYCPPSDYGPPDRWPSQTNYQGYPVYQETRGRHLAGLGADPMNANSTNADLELKDYANELDLLTQADDVVGNGVFDPPGTVGTNYPDQTIFADHIDLPGYIVRDFFYAPSEVTDITTGRPVMMVPAGAVAIDYAQKQAFDNTLLWSLPPEVNPWPLNPPNSVWTVTPQQAAWPVGPIGQTEEDKQESASPAMLFMWAGLTGLTVGLLAALVFKPRRT